jgi:hypothetical protein
MKVGGDRDGETDLLKRVQSISGDRVPHRRAMWIFRGFGASKSLPQSWQT